MFQTFAWNRCWWSAFGAAHELFVVLAYAGAELVGIAPMMISRERGASGRSRRHVRFIGNINGASDYCDFIVDPLVPQALPALLDGLTADAGGFHRIDLSHLPGHSPNRKRILEYFEGRGEKVMVQFEADAPVRILGDRQADLKAANKSSLKRHTRFFEKSGELRFHQCQDADEVLRFLDGFFEQHRSRRAQTGSPSQFLDPAQQSFYRQLVRQAFGQGWLRFDAVLFNGTPLAFHFGFEYRRRFIWYKPTFDVQFASRSPGEVLIKFLLEDAIRRGLQEFDFTVGAEAFKYRFANLTRSNVRVTVFHSSADYWMYRGLRWGRGTLKKILRRDAVSRNDTAAAGATERRAPDAEGTQAGI